jgi:cell wall-associated NlpC family hydrolase
VTTCTWNLRRHAGRITAALGLVAASGLYAPHLASADQLSDLRAQAAALNARIQSLGLQEDALAQQYDAANLAVQAAQAKVAQATAQVASANAAADKAKQALGKEAVDAYVQGGSGLAGNDQTLSNANNSLLRAEYVDSLATDQSDALDSYRYAAIQARTAEANLQAAQSAASDQVNKLAQARSSVQGTQNQLEGAYQQDQGQIATLVQQIQQEQAAAAAAAAQKAAQERAAAQAAAAQQAQQAANQQAANRQAATQQAAAQHAQQAAAQQSSSSSGGGSAAPAAAAASAPAPAAAAPSAPPPVGSGAGGAVGAAESRVGDPYVWGAAGPDSFDCSGLVMWAYEQVGISLPHYSGAQYDDMTHIPMSDLQPGDVVFFSDPGQHEAMYVGNGNIVEAPYTGADVRIVPMYSQFTLAGRVS